MRRISLENEVQKCINVLYSVKQQHNLDIIHYCIKYKCVINCKTDDKVYNAAVKLLEHMDIIGELHNISDYTLIEIIEVYRMVMYRIKVLHSTKEIENYMKQKESIHSLKRGIKLN